MGKGLINWDFKKAQALPGYEDAPSFLQQKSDTK